MINATGTSTATPMSASDYMKQTSGLSKDDFMKLFVTQMKNQDPLAPQDSNAMVAQLAQLTQVEQTYNMNTNMKNMLDAINSSSSMSAVSFLGKSVLAQGNQVSLSPGTQTQLNFNMAEAADRLNIIIKDANGLTVRTLNQSKTAAGDGSMAWDGKDSNGNTLPSGTYSFSVAGINNDGSTFSGTPYIKAVIDGIKLDQGTTVLTAGGVSIPLASVVSVKGV